MTEDYDVWYEKAESLELFDMEIFKNYFFLFQTKNFEDAGITIFESTNPNKILELTYLSNPELCEKFFLKDINVVEFVNKDMSDKDFRVEIYDGLFLDFRNSYVKKEMNGSVEYQLDNEVRAKCFLELSRVLLRERVYERKNILSKMIERLRDISLDTLDFKNSTAFIILYNFLDLVTRNIDDSFYKFREKVEAIELFGSKLSNFYFETVKFYEEVIVKDELIGLHSFKNLDSEAKIRNLSVRIESIGLIDLSSCLNIEFSDLESEITLRDLGSDLYIF